MNKVFLIGRLTKDPEVRTTGTGKKVVSFSIAVNDGRDSSGKDLTHFFDCSAWERLADIVESYVKKGTKVCVMGNLRTRLYDRADGSKAKATDITVRELEILTTKAEAQAMAQQNAQSAPAPSQPAAPQGGDAQPAAKGFDPASIPEIDVNDLEVQMPF